MFIMMVPLTCHASNQKPFAFPLELYATPISPFVPITCVTTPRAYHACTSFLKPDHMDADLHDRIQMLRLELLSGVPRAH